MKATIRILSAVFLASITSALAQQNSNLQIFSGRSYFLSPYLEEALNLNPTQIERITEAKTALANDPGTIEAKSAYEADQENGDLKTAVYAAEHAARETYESEIKNILTAEQGALIEEINDLGTTAWKETENLETWQEREQKVREAGMELLENRLSAEQFSRIKTAQEADQ